MGALARQLFHCRWVAASGMRQTKQLIGGPSALKTKQLLRLDRSSLRTVTGLLTTLDDISL